ncbi:hypothetical protein Tco_1491689 [Tanacetum coccineum]
MKSLNMYNCGLGRIAWNDDDDVIDVLGLDSRLEANLVKLAKSYGLMMNDNDEYVQAKEVKRLETPTASHGLPAARLATSKPPAARLAGADVFLNFVFDVTFDPLGVRTSSLHRWEAYEV